MSKPVLTVDEKATAQTAVDLMDQNNIGVLAIVRHDTPIGILTERDILRRVLAKKKDPSKITVSEIMTKNPVTVGYDATILEVTRLMSENNFRRLLVVKGNKLIGVVTSKDVIEVLSA